MWEFSHATKPRQNVTNNKFNILLVWDFFLPSHLMLESKNHHHRQSTSEKSLKHFKCHFKSEKHTYKSTSVLTWSPEEEKHSDPVDPEEHEADEGPEWLQNEQWEMDEHFPCHVEQCDGEGHALPQEKHHQQEHDLKDYTKMFFYYSFLFDGTTLKKQLSKQSVINTHAVYVHSDILWKLLHQSHIWAGPWHCQQPLLSQMLMWCYCQGPSCGQHTATRGRLSHLENNIRAQSDMHQQDVLHSVGIKAVYIQKCQNELHSHM